jgi:hypothetical protein
VLFVCFGFGLVWFIRMAVRRQNRRRAAISENLERGQSGSAGAAAGGFGLGSKEMPFVAFWASVKLNSKDASPSSSTRN